jgi:hypothetical protein
VHAAILVMSSALAAGGEVVPAGWGERAPAPVAIPGGGCCAAPAAPAAACCDPCAPAGRVRLLDRLRARFARSSSCCDPCAGSSARPNLLEKIRARLGARKDSCCDAPASCCGASPCAPAPAAPVMPGGPVAPPKEMPSPKELPKELPKPPKGSSGLAPGGLQEPLAPKPVVILVRH